MALLAVLETLRQEQVRLGVSPGGQLRYHALEPLAPAVLAGLREHRDVLIPTLQVGVGAALPWPLARLVAACEGEHGPRGPVALPGGLIMNVQDYVLAVAASHACGSRIAEERLWEVHVALGARL